MAEAITFAIAGDDGSEDSVTIPSSMLQLLDDEAPPASIVGDLALMACAERVHAAVHHDRGDPSDQLRAAEAATMDHFERRFGASYAELTGHSH